MLEFEEITALGCAFKDITGYAPTDIEEVTILLQNLKDVSKTISKVADSRVTQTCIMYYENVPPKMLVTVSVIEEESNEVLDKEI